MRVHVYAPAYSEKLSGILEAFAFGINRVAPGTVEVRPLEDPAPCDVAVIFGLVKNSYEPTWAKRAVLERHSGRGLIVIESAFVRRGDYWSVGWGGINGRADFRIAGVGSDRWAALGVGSKPWRRKPKGPVVVCGQLQRDTNVQDTDHHAWCRAALDYYQGLGGPVWFRPHPREKDPSVYGIDAEHFDPNRKIATTLKKARCIVTWNSTSGTDAAIAGVPVIACDAGSFARPVAAMRLMPPYSVPTPPRDDWLAGLGYSQWSLEEMLAGAPWRHLTRA